MIVTLGCIPKVSTADELTASSKKLDLDFDSLPISMEEMKNKNSASKTQDAPSEKSPNQGLKKEIRFLLRSLIDCKKKAKSIRVANNNEKLDVSQHFIRRIFESGNNGIVSKDDFITMKNIPALF